MPRLSLEEVISKFKKVHGDKYDYSLITEKNYIDTKHEVKITCNTCGNIFKQLPQIHLMGCGCRLCANKRISKSKRGIVRNDLKHLIFGVGICDVEHSVIQEDGKVILSYYTWRDMLRRCYSQSFQEKEPSYKGCVVCNDWMRYANFKQWFDDPKNGYKDGYCLDKDIIIKGNKMYSPDACCFVPREINSLLTNRKNHRGKYPIGVIKASKSNNFESAFFKNGKRIYLGSFKTTEEAFVAYKKAKESHIKDVAQEYYDKGEITEKVYDALMKYEVEITD